MVQQQIQITRGFYFLFLPFFFIVYLEIHACPFVPFSCSGRLQLNGPWQLRKGSTIKENEEPYGQSQGTV